MQRRRMELDELDVADFRPGAIRGGDAIAGGDVRIGSFEKHVTESAGGEQSSASLDFH